MDSDKYRVLILDDDFQLGELLRDFLQSRSQCAVTYISRVGDLWSNLAAGANGVTAFDILFLDYMLGSTTGLDILEEINTRGIKIPTVMMTGEGNEHIAAKAIQLGALDYLVKGEYSISTLPPLIIKAVRQREMERSMERYLEQTRYQAALLNSMRDAVVVWDLNGKITYWNNAAESLYHAPACERIGRQVEDVYFPCFEPPVSLARQAPGKSTPLEHIYRCADGASTWISSLITTLVSEGESPQPFGYMDVARDVTPRKKEQEALLQSQKFVQRILDTSPNVIYILDLQRKCMQYVNPEVKMIIGFGDEEIMRWSPEEFMAHLHPEDQQDVVDHIKTLTGLLEGEVAEVEFRYKDSSGEWRWLKSREAVFSRDELGTVSHVIGSIQDVSSNKDAEAKIEQRLKSEKLLATISNKFLNLALHDTDAGIRDAMLQVVHFIEVSFGMVFLLDHNHLVPYHLYRAQPGLKMNFYLPDIDLDQLEIPYLLDLLRQRDYVIFNSPAELPEAAEGERRLLAQMGLQSGIFVPMLHNHELYGMVVLGTTRAGFAWTDEKVYMLQTFGEIITNSVIQKQVDQALRKSEARYRAIVEEHQTEMICRFLPDTTISFANEAFCRYYGKERRQVIGTSFLDPFCSPDRDAVQQKLSQLSTTAPVARFEHRVALKNGEIRWQEWTSRAIFDQRSDFIEFQAVGHDITDRKKVEQQLKTAQTHLTQAARLASIGELASGVAHQISNPLTTIIADAQILLQQLDRRHPGRESAEAIVQAGWRTQQVINELMKFSQPAQATRELVSINETIEKALLLSSAHLQAYGIKVLSDLAPSLPALTGNGRQLTDLWLNLLLLARSACDDGRRHTIKVRTRQATNKTVQVEVSDDGRPIPREQFDTIFEPQLVPAGSGLRGTGMELSLCREIVRQNRGNISVSASGYETTFRIDFDLEG